MFGFSYTPRADEITFGESITLTEKFTSEETEVMTMVMTDPNTNHSVWMTYLEGKLGPADAVAERDRVLSMMGPEEARNENYKVLMSMREKIKAVRRRY